MRLRLDAQASLVNFNLLSDVVVTAWLVAQSHHGKHVHQGPS